MGLAWLQRPDVPAVLLRIGLALTLLYAAIGSLANPNDWVGYVPAFVREIFDSQILFTLFAFYQLGLVIWLASGRYLRFAALVCAATFGGILLANLALLDITFRDIGLTFAALALMALSTKNQKK